MSPNIVKSSKICTFQAFGPFVAQYTLYALWFGLTPHKMFIDLTHPIMFITDIDEEISFGFVIEKIDHTLEQLHIRTQFISHEVLQEFLNTKAVSIISGDIAPNLINFSD